MTSMLSLRGIVLRVWTRPASWLRHAAGAGFLAFALIGAHGPARAEVPVGAVEQTQGEAMAAQTGQRPRRLTPGATILSNDTLLTGPDGRLAARLADDTQLTRGKAPPCWSTASSMTLQEAGTAW